jgi:hypothetical protein
MDYHLVILTQKSPLLLTGTSRVVVLHTEYVVQFHQKQKSLSKQFLMMELSVVALADKFVKSLDDRKV